MLNVDDIMDALIDAELDDDYVPNEATKKRWTNSKQRCLWSILALTSGKQRKIRR